MWKQHLDGYGVFLGPAFFSHLSDHVYRTGLLHLPSEGGTHHIFPPGRMFWGGHSITISLLDEGLEGHAIIFNDTDEHICCSLEPFTFLDIHFSCCAPDLKLVIQAPFPPQELLSFTLKLQHVSIDFPSLFPTFLYKKSILRSLQTLSSLTCLMCARGGGAEER